jgi:tetratricopeptide (TPR) repeat protein
MTLLGVRHATPLRTSLIAIAALAAVASCGPDRIDIPTDGPYPPGVDQRKQAEDGVEVGNRLMAAGEYELALDAFTRAALDEGMTGDILTSMGTANLGLGRLGQAETLLRRAVEVDETSPEAWNNLGALLVEQNKLPEAERVLRTAYALDNGESDSIRDNLRLVLAKMENSDNIPEQNEEYKLVRRGGSDYLIRKTP